MSLINNSKKGKIYTINARDNIILSLIDDYNQDMSIEISHEFNLLLKKLSYKNIDYYKLKNALVPTRDENKSEYIFVFNSKYCKDITMFYGEKIFDKVLSILNKESTQSILAGDYVKIQGMDRNVLKELLIDNIEYINKCDYEDNMDYFIIYINNMSKKQVQDMIQELRKCDYFVGISDLKYTSKLKQYLAFILSPICIKYKDTVIVEHLSDRDDENFNERDYPYEKNGFKLKSINEMLYNIFLTYKIENNIFNKEEIKFSYTYLTNIVPEYKNIKVIIDEEKLNYLKQNKEGTMKSLNLLNIKKEELEKYILINMYSNYIYNIEVNDYGVLKFNILLELTSKDEYKMKKKVLVALKYIPSKEELRLITLY